METYIAASCWSDIADTICIEKIEAKDLKEAEFIFLKSLYFGECFIEKNKNATLEDLKENIPDTFSYTIKNIMNL